MQVTLTSMQGNTRKINLMSKQEVLYFIDLYKATLLENQRVKITCDLLGIDGYLQGAREIQFFGGSTLVCSLLFLVLLYSYVYRTSNKNIQILAKPNL